MKFYTTRQAAEIADKHWKTVTIALETGELHGYQRAKNAHWRIDENCLRSWLEARDCAHRSGPTAPGGYFQLSEEDKQMLMAIREATFTTVAKKAA